MSSRNWKDEAGKPWSRSRTGAVGEPAERNYQYTFDSLSVTIEAFLDALNVGKFAVYIFDYGVRTLSRSLLPLCPHIEPNIEC